MKPFVRSLIAIGSLGAIAVVAGPAQAEEDTGIATDMLECQKVEQPRGAARSEAHGFTQLVDQALAKANLNEQQAQELSQLGQAIDAQEAAVHDAKRGLMLALAQQMEQGQINRQGLENEVKQLADARQSAGPAMKAALDRIHQVLNPEQRKAFADALESAIQQRAQAVSQGGWLNQWSQELGLNDQQKSQVQQILNQLRPTMEHHQQQMQRVLSAFRGQSFNIDQIVPQREATQEAREGAERIVGIAQQIAQVLTPQQRQLAAKKIVQNACAKVGPQQGAPSTAPRTNQSQSPLEGENVGTSEDEIIIRRGGLWGGRGFGTFRNFNRFGTFWGGPGFNYYGGVYPYASTFGYPYASTLGFGRTLGFGGVWPGFTGYSYAYPYVGGSSFFW